MEKGFSIVTCHFSSQTVIYQWIKSDNKEITEDIIDYILYSIEKGCSMQGMEDPEVKYLNVLVF